MRGSETATASATASASNSVSASVSASERVLDAIREADPGVGVPVAALAEKLGLSAAVVKKAVDELLVDGMIEELKKRPRVVALIRNEES